MERGTVVDVGRRLWHFCHTLRHDGIDYAEYLDQLTYLLFLKMAEERLITLPGVTWADLKSTPDDRLLATYRRMLRTLKNSDDVVGDVYASATCAFTGSGALRDTIRLLDSVRWSSLPSDVQADAYEYLLEQAAAEGKKGAGQYFTPRPLMSSVVACVKPGSARSDRVVADPAAGTAGFLVAAHAWAKENAPKSLRGRRELRFSGTELVTRPRRLALMNLLLHGVQNFDISLADSLTSPFSAGSADVVLTNPPFGVKGGRAPRREDFWCTTTNKQLNFVQHVVQLLRPGGRAAVVLPDNCFFGSASSQLIPGLVERCDVHTILRLPIGTFAPYTAGTKTNVVFFTKGLSTRQLWIYDARTPKPVASRTTPLTKELLEDFQTCFGEDPFGQAARSTDAPKTDRWHRFDRGELAQVDYEVDRLPWRMTSALSAQRNERPTDLLRAIVEDLDAAAEDVRRLIKRLAE